MKTEPSLTNSQSDFGKPKLKFNPILQNLGAPHIDSFNYMLDQGIADCIANLHPVKFDLVNGDVVKLTVEEFTISPPALPQSTIQVRSRKIYPSECRQRYGTYKGMGHVRIGWELNGVRKLSIERDLGEFPIMLKSKICNLNGLSPKQLVERGEHDNEWGGYFISKGNERLIRMLLMTRRNYPIVLKRNTWKDRGDHFSETGILIRCVHSDQTSKNNVLHFLNNGTVKLMFSMGKRLSYVPVILMMKCLVNYTDEKIYDELIKGFEDDLYYRECIQNMLREVHEEGIHAHKDAVEYFGDIFRLRTTNILPPSVSAFQVTRFILNDAILIHLSDNVDKFNLLVFMIQKLFHFIENKSKCENVDCIAMMELMLGGHLYQKIVKEKLEQFLQRIKFVLFKQVEKVGGGLYQLTQAEMTQAVKSAGSFSDNIANFLATGNLPTGSGLGMMQISGLVILAENINRMRYMSHFRAVHRGSFFVEMRTTEARQLLPDAWGFICPVHTPDGSPCGLLNHLTVNCVVTSHPEKEMVENVEKVLFKYGMVPSSTTIDNYNNYYPVLLEGKIIGYLGESNAANVVEMIRILKIDGIKVPKMMEIVLVPKRKLGQYPGLYLFIGPARMVRPVLNLKANQIEYIGTFEQIYLDVCIKSEEAYPGITTHMELSKTDFLSNLANLIPMPDCNQSPRNMYQCQMGKQTMGTPCHNFQLQSFTKLYRLQTPATPLFRPVHHDNIELDDFAMGTNAIVAVISYTGYDMEDAMIINKAAIERGFAHGSIFSTTKVEIENNCYFARDPHNYGLEEFLGSDGLPQPGTILEPKSVIACYFDVNISAYKTIKFAGHESVVVDNVKLGTGYESDSLRQAFISYRTTRNPSVGDKFASRAGQKGICSQRWPAEDLPFTDSGLIPDIVFNPHGFPSRMTIAMMIETMAGKTGAINGLVHDATPFKFTEDDTAINYFGKLLEKSGYNYYGTERLYSGIDGREMEADIFFGVVHYQRLRHMVSDKWQVRSTGTIDAVTHQPIKGRKRGGGIRFGEMERDALISHGAAFLLQDRLLHCSDKTSVSICKNCGTLLSPLAAIIKRRVSSVDTTKTPATCKLCQDGTQICNIEIPYIFKYLVTQLSSLNINVKLNLSAE